MRLRWLAYTFGTSLVFLFLMFTTLVGTGTQTDAQAQEDPTGAACDQYSEYGCEEEAEDPWTEEPVEEYTGDISSDRDVEEPGVEPEAGLGEADEGLLEEEQQTRVDDEEVQDPVLSAGSQTDDSVVAEESESDVDELDSVEDSELPDSEGLHDGSAENADLEGNEDTALENAEAEGADTDAVRSTESEDKGDLPEGVDFQDGVEGDPTGTELVSLREYAPDDPDVYVVRTTYECGDDECGVEDVPEEWSCEREIVGAYHENGDKVGKDYPYHTWDPDPSEKIVCYDPAYGSGDVESLDGEPCWKTYDANGKYLRSGSQCQLLGQDVPDGFESPGEYGPGNKVMEPVWLGRPDGKGSVNRSLYQEMCGEDNCGLDAPKAYECGTVTSRFYDTGGRQLGDWDEGYVCYAPDYQERLENDPESKKCIGLYDAKGRLVTWMGCTWDGGPSGTQQANQDLIDLLDGIDSDRGGEDPPPTETPPGETPPGGTPPENRPPGGESPPPGGNPPSSDGPSSDGPPTDGPGNGRPGGDGRGGPEDNGPFANSETNAEPNLPPLVGSSGSSSGSVVPPGLLGSGSAGEPGSYLRENYADQPRTLASMVATPSLYASTGGFADGITSSRMIGRIDAGDASYMSYDVMRLFTVDWNSSLMLAGVEPEDGSPGMSGDGSDDGSNGGIDGEEREDGPNRLEKLLRDPGSAIEGGIAEAKKFNDAWYIAPALLGLVITGAALRRWKIRRRS